MSLKKTNFIPFDIREIFAAWLAENASRFIHKPIRCRRGEKFDMYYFKGIIPSVHMNIDEGIDVWYRHGRHSRARDHNLDILLDFMYGIVKKGRSYTVTGLLEPRLFDSPEAIALQYCEWLVEWTNEFILADNFLLIEGWKDSFFSAKIIYDADRLEKISPKDDAFIGLLRLGGEKERPDGG